MQIDWNDGWIIQVPSGKPVFVCRRPGGRWGPCHNAHRHGPKAEIRLNPDLTVEEVALVDETIPRG